MKRTIVFALASVLALAAAIPATAQSQNDRGSNARDDRSGAREHMIRHRRDGQRIQAFAEEYDTDGDGSITQAEIDAVRADRLAAFDADGDGQLTLDEYQALWLDAMRTRMVDRFQAHDDDGDGLITNAEFNEEFANLVDRRDRNGDGVLNADDREGRRAGPTNPTDETDQ